ncbi:MAG TPA: helix-turn-helix domain-containing protein [Blastocatellia bacterium]|nr:helix-turn-helix domain-containing protein [Blastocatellia bacterium]HMV86846.1 helix-turn-helix domain-containing protein [Blastocatellia bacterium]HMX25028.1 helix-turn-helix domain-containing protein [Blastocatellia bacterium]HMY74282.1 helix-turn-helix domain-containing protein [Blastocatellia bacterium]HMZ18748.1 helix-turn-helix domain-containing protein [Blastocatellia bacterium]
MCPVTITLRVIGGRWKPLILYHLFQDVKRFSELQHALGRVSQKVLTQQLRELERDGIVRREVFPQVPPKVEYSLTALGRSLKPVIQQMSQWGQMFNAGTPPENGVTETLSSAARNGVAPAA